MTRHRRTSMFFLRLGSSSDLLGSLQVMCNKIHPKDLQKDPKNVSKMLPLGSLGPHLAYLAFKTEEDRRKYSKLRPKWRHFWHFEFPLGHLGPLLEGPGVKIWCPRSILCTLLKHRFLLLFLLVFGGLGSPVELQMVASAPLWGPCGGLSVLFGCKKCCIEFWSHKVTKRSGRGR